MRCPCCNLELQEVIQPENSFLNEYQWESIKAGDYYCINCKPDIEGMKYKYFWKKEIKL